ncbi:MAG: CHAT domain-containing protein [Burkholderiaceae bacterium]|nr:CHAT domain-containing protein [Burkholderiaceae bacterium]
MPQPPSPTLTLRLNGRVLARPELPPALQAGLRGAADGSDDAFLPSGWVQAVGTVDLAPASRGAPGAAPESLAAAPGQVLAIELDGGITVYTSPDNLQRTLAQLAPDALGADGSLDLAALETRAAGTRAVRSEVAQRLVTRVTTLDVGRVGDAITSAAQDKLREWLGDAAGDALAQLGVSWWGTKALMWAIEDRHGRAHGLYRWQAGEAKPGTLFAPQDDPRLQRECALGPALLFIHGTASSTAGGFGDVQTGNLWPALAQQYGERIYAFDHRTLSESPIGNALQLARTLPAGARLHLVTHSRGGLVGDLLCLHDLDTPAAAALIEAYALDSVALGNVPEDDRERVAAELQRVYARQREELRELAALLRDKQLRIERYVRVASPARGTRLASGNFDVFLSGLLSLIGLVPLLAGSPLYSAFKRVVLEIAKNRTRPNLVPGIEAMLPESPIARLLARAPSQRGLALGLIAGDIEGGGLFKRLGVLFTDHMFFDGVDNDLVVDSDSMSAGIARPANARLLFDQGPEVNHFRYFSNAGTREGLRQWLASPEPLALPQFAPLPALAAEPGLEEERARSAARSASRGVDAATLPLVLLLPGVMGSHLWVRRSDRVWLDPADLLAGGLAKLADGRPDVEAEKLVNLAYGDLCDHLAATHRVETFAYDWRLPLDRLADALAPRLRAALDATQASPSSGQAQRPVRVLAHSMGGLVVRALAVRHAALWQELMARDGARFIMLGTPNQGSHQMVETLIGKSDMIRMLGRADFRHSLQQVLDIVVGFRGALSLLPRPGFADSGGEQLADYFQPAVWTQLKTELRDFWFGNGVVGTPSAAVLSSARWLWDQGAAATALPAAHAQRVFYVHGCASRTACGLVKRNGRWQMLATPHGDGTVSWASGKLAAGVGQYLYMPAEHGSLADTPAYFESIESLLSRGEPGLLMTSPPAVRDAAEAAAAPRAYEAGPPQTPSDAELANALLARRPRTPARPRGRSLAVRVRAMDLREVQRPILVGHYEQDAIAGAEALIDRELVGGMLHKRYDLGMYAGPLGSATVVLPQANAMERARGSRRGAVVAGLGAYDGTLGASALTEAVRAAVLRLLLQLHDEAGSAAVDEAEAGVPLASLLLGYNSSAQLSLGDAVGALLRGVLEANRKFNEATGAPWHVADLEIVELYRDTAISATRALQRVAATLNAERSLRCRIEAAPLLAEGEGVRQRLQDAQTASYWSRLMIADAATADEAGDDGAEDHPLARSARGAGRRPRGMQRVLADRLRFLYLGSGRARVETVVQQRQPGLVERLVDQQIFAEAVDPAFGHTLFQLLVPHDLKDTVRQFDRTVLVVDGATANLPWELMQVDGRPLAVQAGLVRQLSSTRFRPRVRQTAERCALVIGNPSSEGFGQAFSDADGRSFGDLDTLPGAEREARAVAELLRGQQWQVATAIGPGERALGIVNQLLARPWRVLHVAAHGVTDLRHVDGQQRTGVVLSDGLMLGAAEIGAMDSVPELVFLNCCHLGQMDRAPTPLNRLAYSVARELIEVGVRAVVVAGWAVSDQAATLFAETLYRGLLAERLAFGDAVRQARRRVHERMPQCTTWGAYQAYGDPGWRLEPKPDDDKAGSGRVDAAAPLPVAPAELIDELQQQRRALARLGPPPGAAQAEQQAQALRQRLQALQAPAVGAASWLERPDVAVAVARLLADLGPAFFAEARDWYLRAIRDRAGLGRGTLGAQAPVDAVEQLANLEARHGERLGERLDEGRGTADLDAGLALVRSAIARLVDLLRLGAEQPPEQAVSPANVIASPERASLLGSAFKRLAVLHARAAAARPDDARRHRGAMEAALRDAASWYGAAAGPLDAEPAQPYAMLNALMLVAVAPEAEDYARAAQPSRLAAARRCASVAARRHAHSRDPWDAVMAADADLAAALLDGTLADAGAAGEARVQSLASGYSQAMTGVAIAPRLLDSVLSQQRMLAELLALRGQPTLAQRLRELAGRLSPTAAAPAGPAPAQAAPAAVPAKKAAPRRRRKPAA